MKCEIHFEFFKMIHMHWRLQTTILAILMRPCPGHLCGDWLTGMHGLLTHMEIPCISEHGTNGCMLGVNPCGDINWPNILDKLYRGIKCLDAIWNKAFVYFTEKRPLIFFSDMTDEKTKTFPYIYMHYSGVTWPSCCLNSIATVLFVQQLV